MTEAELAKLLKGHVLVLTGAGISAASGVPTFRGTDGLYEGLNPYELASPEAFRARPLTVWNWYLMRIHGAKDCRPNAAHYALAELEELAKSVTIITSNVDPFHQQAGSSQVYRLHGNLLERRCASCGSLEPMDPATLPERYEEPPLCQCGGMWRPNVVWFGERPWVEAFDAYNRVVSYADVLLEVGTSGVVSYGFTEHAARHGIPTVRINPDGSEGMVSLYIAEGAEVALPRLVALTKS